MRVSDVRYAKSGDLRLAYQEFGDGPPLLVIPALLSNMEVAWEHEYIRRIYDLLGRHLHISGIAVNLAARVEQAATDGEWSLFAIESAG